MTQELFEQQKKQEAIFGGSFEELVEFFKKQPLVYPEWQGPLEVDISRPEWKWNLTYNRKYWNE